MRMLKQTELTTMYALETLESAVSERLVFWSEQWKKTNKEADKELMAMYERKLEEAVAAKIEYQVYAFARAREEN